MPDTAFQSGERHGASNNSGDGHARCPTVPPVRGNDLARWRMAGAGASIDQAGARTPYGIADPPRSAHIWLIFPALSVRLTIHSISPRASTGINPVVKCVIRRGMSGVNC